MRTCADEKKNLKNYNHPSYTVYRPNREMNGSRQEIYCFALVPCETWLRISNIGRLAIRWCLNQYSGCTLFVCTPVRGEQQTQSINVIHTLQFTMRRQHEHRRSADILFFFYFYFALLDSCAVHRHACKTRSISFRIRFYLQQRNGKHYPCASWPLQRAFSNVKRQ